MIKFSVDQTNGTLTVNKEDVEMFYENVMTSDQVAGILAGGNDSSKREIKRRLNSGSDFAILVPEERFNKLNYGYGLCDGHNVKIVMYFNLKHQLCFLSYICGHATTISVQDGDVFSSEPLMEEHEEIPVKDTKEYRSKLFSLANKIRGEHHVSQKEAYRLAKEQLEELDKQVSASANAPETEDANDNDETIAITFEDILGAIKDVLNSTTNNHENNDTLKSEPENEVDSIGFLTTQFKKLANVLADLNQIEGEINRFMNNRRNEKRVDPTPQSVNPLSIIGAMLEDLFSGNK